MQVTDYAFFPTRVITIQFDDTTQMNAELCELLESRPDLDDRFNLQPEALNLVRLADTVPAIAQLRSMFIAGAKRWLEVEGMAEPEAIDLCCSAIAWVAASSRLCTTIMPISSASTTLAPASPTGRLSMKPMAKITRSRRWRASAARSAFQRELDHRVPSRSCEGLSALGLDAGLPVCLALCHAASGRFPSPRFLHELHPTLPSAPPSVIRSRRNAEPGSVAGRLRLADTARFWNRHGQILNDRYEKPASVSREGFSAKGANFFGCYCRSNRISEGGSVDGFSQ